MTDHQPTVSAGAPPGPDPTSSEGGPTGGVSNAHAGQSHLLAALLNNTADHVYFKDEQCRFTLISRSTARLFGLQSPDDAIGKTDFDFFTEEHARKAYEDEQAIIRTGLPLINREERETWRDGRSTWVSSTKMPLLDSSGKVVGTFGVSRDITQRKRVEDELQRHRDTLEERIEARTRELRVANEQLQREMADRHRAEKALMEGERIAAIRSMAGGVAVAFNNVIGIISSYAASIAANFIPKTRVHDEASRILDAAKRAAALTERLMNMAHAPEAGRVQPADTIGLADVIRDATGFVDDMFRDRNVRIVVAHPETMPYVRGDRVQLVDALLTFLINAAEAMPNGGTVRVDASERTIATPPAKSLAAPGDYAILRIRDTGVGMTREVRKRIFEPFFTTKSSGSSFGLGMTFAHSAVQGMGGWIRVSSRPDRGSSFRIYVPRAEAPSGIAEAPARSKLSAESRVVLVVDDDPESLALMKGALEPIGFTVLTADSPQTAVSLYGRNVGKIAISILDGVMQDGGTTRVLKRIRRSEPQACLLVTSGFSRDYVRGVLPPSSWGFLQKPFDGPQLVKAVADTLERFRT